MIRKHTTKDTSMQVSDAQILAARDSHIVKAAVDAMQTAADLGGHAGAKRRMAHLTTKHFRQ